LCGYVYFLLMLKSSNSEARKAVARHRLGKHFPAANEYTRNIRRIIKDVFYEVRAVSNNTYALQVQ
jgi:hypothetical protein